MASPDREVDRVTVPRPTRVVLRVLAPHGYADSLVRDVEDEANEIAAGMGAREARRWLFWQTLHSIPPLARERVRRRRSGPTREVTAMTTASWVNDGKYAWRRLRRAPGFAAVAVLTLALGVGATSAIFSLAYAVWLKPLPYPVADRLVNVLDRHVKSGSTAGLAGPEIAEMRDGTRSFSGLAAYAYAAQAARINGERVRFEVDPVTPNIFTVLGVAPALGRVLTAADLGQRVLVISHATWVSHFGGAPDVLSRTIDLSGDPYSIVGVMPSTFRFPEILPADAWQASDFSGWTDRAQRYMSIVARLAPGVTIDRARLDVATEAARLAQAYPATNAGWTATVLPLDDRDQYGTAFGGLLGIVGLFLVVGCANLAGLLIARNVDRRGELAVCASLGATRTRLARQLLIETAVLGAAGGGLGLLLASLVIRVLAAAMPANLPGIEDAGIGLPVVGFCAAVSGLTVLICGLLPALNARSFSASEALTGSRRAAPRSQRLHAALVVSQVAVSMILVVGATLMAQSFTKLLNRDRGFNPHGVFALDVSLGFDEDKYTDNALRARTFEQIVARAAGLPGVEHAGAANGFPGSALGILGRALLHPDGGSSQKDVVGALRSATPDYFAAMGVRLRAGRVFQSSDTAAAPRVAIVNQTLARAMWPDGTAIGRTLSIPRPDDQTQTQTWTVVGVVDDMHLGERAPADIFLPVAQRPAFWIDLVMRTTGNPSALKEVVRRALIALNPDLLIENETAIDAIISRSVSLERAQSALAAVIAVLSALVSGVGLYSMLAFAVARRRRELGIRLALGSAPRALFLSVFAGGMRLALAGVLVGAIGTAAIVRVLDAKVFGLASASPWAYALGALMLASIAAAAVWAPARRALRTDPLVAMRAE